MLETDLVSHSYLLYTCGAILVILFRRFPIIFLTCCRNCNLHKWGCVLVSATNSNRYVILCIYLIFVEVYWNLYIWSAYISLIVLFQSNFNSYRHQEQTNTFVIILTQVIEIFFFIVVLKCFQTAIIWRRSIRKCHNSVSCLRVSWLVICYE